MRIAIDPGHGGKDPGATANGLLEKDITFESE
jgi:N-acetylmuramoyl-L-alanine amidase